ncbi:MAG: FAD-binding oxidoreductase [Candidatus Nanopelagicales bacterium]
MTYPFYPDLTPLPRFDASYWQPKPRPKLANALRNAVAGEVIAPGDVGWDQARAAWHLVVDQHPAAVVRVADADDVAATVKVARDLGVPVSPQPGGHGATGSPKSTVDGTIVLRTEALDEIHVSRYTSRLRVGAGVRWGRALAALDGTETLALAGSSAGTSVVGYSVGGGLSWFSRRYGYAAHSVRALDIVDANGKQCRVTADEDPDLFWALRGGGGDFAVVTAIETELYPAPTLFGGSLIYSGEQLHRVWDAYLQVTRCAPEELSVWLRLANLPNLPFIPEPMRGRLATAVYFTYVGDPERGERLIAPLRRAARRLVENVGPFSISQLGAIADEPSDPVPASLGAVLLDDLGAEVQDIVAAAVTAPGTPINLLALRHLGGALRRSSVADGAAGTVDEPYLLMAAGIGPSADALVGVPRDIDRLLGDLSGHHRGRVPFNFSDRLDPADSLPEATLTRLRAIKRERDPDGLIRSNRPVLGAMTVTPDDVAGI